MNVCNLDSVPPKANSRDIIMREIASQAATVRRTFEDHQTKRKHAVSSATAAAAHHMASLNRKRKFENSLVIRANAAAVKGGARPDYIWNKTSRTFHSPIASFTRPEKKRATIGGGGGKPSAGWRRGATAASSPRISDGIVLKATPHDITVSYNDVVCGKGKTTSTLVGNQRYRVWIRLKKESFTKAPYEEDRCNIARSIVDAVATSVPRGRFLSLNVHTGLWYDVGYERATGIALEALMAETGMMTGRGAVIRPCGTRKASVQREFASRAA